MPEDQATGDDSAPETAPPRRRRARRYAIGTAVVLVFALVLRCALREGSAQERTSRALPPVPIVAATAIVRDLPVYLDAIGTVTPVFTASITSQVTGRVEAVHYREGQTVRTGTPLVDIDARPFEATLMQAEGTLERDQHVLAQAVMDRDRFRAAWARRAISKQQLDDQEKVVLQDEATVKLDRGVVAYDRVQLGYCHITAPFAGRVGLRLVDPGNLVAANGGTVLVVITQVRPITVVFTLSEDDLGDVLSQPDHGANLPVLVLDRVKSRTLATGTLITVDNQIDTTTGTLRVRARFDNQDEALFPNQFVNARLLVRTVRAATVVPSSAVQHNGEIAFVYVVQDGRVHMQRVTTGVADGEATQVTGIAPGTVVADSSFDKLRDGAAVAVRHPPAAQPSASTDEVRP